MIKNYYNLLYNWFNSTNYFWIYFFSTGIINSFRNLKLIAWTTLIFGILMYFADTF